MEEKKHKSKEAEQFVEEGIKVYSTIEKNYKKYLTKENKKETKEGSEEENER